MQYDAVEETICLWLELWTSETDERLKSEYVALTRVFSELSKHRDRWQQTLESLDVKKSAFLEEIRTEGRQEGHLEEKAALIVQLLRMRFPNQVPTDLSATIEATRACAFGAMVQRCSNGCHPGRLPA